MKLIAAFFLGSLVLVLGGCAGAPFVHPLERLRNLSMSTVEGYAEQTAKFLTTGSEDEAIAKAQSAIAASLKDPASAQFRNLRITPFGGSGKVVCGEVNAKNSYGGYVGFTRFVAGVYAGELYQTERDKNIQSAANAGLLAACR